MAKRLIKDFGPVAIHGTKELKLQIIRGFDNVKRLTLVSCKDGMSLNAYEYTKEEAKELKRLLEEELGYTTPITEPEPEEIVDETVETTEPTETAEPIPFSEEAVTNVRKDKVRSLTSLPANDINFRTALRESTYEEIEEAIRVMETDENGRHKTRIMFCKSRLEVMSRPKKSANTVDAGITRFEEEIRKADTKEEKLKTTVTAKILTFPTADKKPMFIQLKTEGNATYEECAEKLGKEKEMWKDADSQYVIDGIMELAKVDQDFRNNIMREDKTYAGFMEYMYKAAQNGYCVKYGNNMGWIDRDTGLGLAIDYYNNDDEKVEAEEKKRREEEAEKRKKEAEAKAKTTKTTKKGVKKNDKNIGKNKKRVNA